VPRPATRQLRIGISGWTYGPWRGVFYPPKLSQKRELEFASCQLNSIEINGSFYSLQTPNAYRTWYDATPKDFVFSLKGGRFLTHIKKLRDVRIPLANFLASGVLLLKEKLGPILWQFPPNFAYDRERFAEFFKLLPHTTAEAAKLAREHDPKLKHRVWTETDEDRPLRHAVEVRHVSFENCEFIELLRENDIALVFADSAGRWPYAEDVTSDFVYIRLHGDVEIYVSGYTDEALDAWAKKIKAWHEGAQPPDAKLLCPALAARRKTKRDVFVYFDNDVKVRSPIDAITLSRKLGVPCGEIGGTYTDAVAQYTTQHPTPLPADRWRFGKRIPLRGRKAAD